MADGAGQLQKGLTEGAAKLRAALWLEKQTGLHLTGRPPARPPTAAERGPAAARDGALARASKQASAALLGTGLAATGGRPPTPGRRPRTPAADGQGRRPAARRCSAS